MSKQVKCKKCHLTYDKKKYECPYCHKKRFNPTGLIIFLIILVIAAGAVYYFYGDTLKENLIPKQDIIETNQSGLLFNNFTIEPSAETPNEYTIKFDVTNKTDATIEKAFIITNLADKVKAPIINGTYISWREDYKGMELRLIPEEIYKVEYTINMENWQTLEVYLSEYTNDENGIKDMKIFTYENNPDLTETSTETEKTQISIITE